MEHGNADTDYDSDQEELNVPKESEQRFRRSTPLPIRVRDGGFTDDALLAGGEEIPWSSIEFVALAIIDQMVKDSEPKAGPLRQMVKKVMSGGEDKESAKDRAKQTRQLYLLDVFTSEQDQPYRFESSIIHYKTFLDKVGYVSHHNFFRFCVHFARRLQPSVQTNTSFISFLAKNRDKVAHFDDYHDFELEFSQQRRLNRDLVSLEGVDLSVDSWVEEWDDDE